jgi:putative endonuclease
MGLIAFISAGRPRKVGGKGAGQKSQEGSMDQVPHPQTHYVYMVCCANGALYTGYTTNVERRIALHNAGKGGRYTRSHRPVVLVATWTFNCKGEALRAERELKRLPRKQKLRLAEQVTPLKGEGS